MGAIVSMANGYFYTGDELYTIACLCDNVMTEKVKCTQNILTVATAIFGVVGGNIGGVGADIVPINFLAAAGDHRSLRTVRSKLMFLKGIGFSSVDDALCIINAAEQQIQK